MAGHAQSAATKAKISAGVKRYYANHGTAFTPAAKASQPGRRQPGGGRFKGKAQVKTAAGLRQSMGGKGTKSLITKGKTSAFLVKSGPVVSASSAHFKRK